MRWASISLAAYLGFSGVSCYPNDILGGNMIAGYQVLSGMRSPGHQIKNPNDSHSHLGRRQDTGRCGSSFNNQVCASGLCCSHWGYCGTGHDFCSDIASCQPQYGYCGDAPPPSASSSTVLSSSTALPPLSSSTVLPPLSTSSSVAPPSSSTTPPPLSSSSSTVPIISTSSTLVSPPLPSSTLVVTSNGMCGNSTTCAGSGFGLCCSQYWYCGNTIDYCGIGCHSQFGLCIEGIPSSSPINPQPSSTPVVSSSSRPPVVSTSSPPPIVSTSSVPPPPPSSSSVQPPPSSTPTSPGLPVSTDSTCGNGITCLGSAFGNCCSQYGFCGSQPVYCGAVFSCQPQFGTCDST